MVGGYTLGSLSVAFLVCEYILGSLSVAYCFWLTVTLTFGLGSRKIMSGAYLLYYFR